MASITAVRDGLRARLETIAGLRVPDRMPGTIMPPAILVAGPEISWDATMARGSDDFLFTLTLLVSKSWDRAAEDNLDAYLAGSGTSSIKATLEAEPADLGVPGIDFVRVARTQNYGMIGFGDGDRQIPYLGCEFVTEVTADGT